METFVLTSRGDIKDYHIHSHFRLHWFVDQILYQNGDHKSRGTMAEAKFILMSYKKLSKIDTKWEDLWNNEFQYLQWNKNMHKNRWKLMMHNYNYMKNIPLSILVQGLVQVLWRVPWQLSSPEIQIKTLMDDWWSLIRKWIWNGVS